MLLGTLLLVSGQPLALAQDNPPDLRMLLNLDLFGSEPPSAAAESRPEPSIFDQIRTLSSMGYLGDPADGAAPPISIFGGPAEPQSEVDPEALAP